MLRRSILQLQSRRSDKRLPVQITSQIPTFLSSRKAFSVQSQQSPLSTGKTPKSGSLLPKILVGSVAVGAVSVTAYQTGYLDKYLPKEHRKNIQSVQGDTRQVESLDLLKSSKNLQADEHGGESNTNPSFREPDISAPAAEDVEKNKEATSEPSPEESSIRKDEIEVETKDTSNTIQEGTILIQEEHLPTQPESSTLSNNLASNTNLSQESPIIEGQEADNDQVQRATVEKTAPVPKDIVPNEQSTDDDSKGDTDIVESQPSSLLDEYLLSNKGEEEGPATGTESQDEAGTIEDAYISKDGKLVLDFLQAIHAAEQRQAELDAIAFAAERKIMKEKYEKELRDSRARELMYAEREAILEKELNKEKVKAAAALKSLQEKLEDRHRMELEEQENEAKLKEKKLLELAKAELTAAIASEKAFQIDKMAEANLHIDALCMAFYARSKEARHSHSIHKLALGALALEDALSKGLPIQKEIDALHPYLEDIDKESLLGLVLSSLPKETLNIGTDTLLQLNHKFDALKGTLRHFSLIPPGGGGILAHSLASLASLLKVREANKSGDGIESLINRVESFLAEGKLSEAAETLEKGVEGTQAAEVVGDWVRRARNRAITEQALTVLQSYATSVSLT